MLPGPRDRGGMDVEAQIATAISERSAEFFPHRTPATADVEHQVTGSQEAKLTDDSPHVPSGTQGGAHRPGMPA